MLPLDTHVGLWRLRDSMIEAHWDSIGAYCHDSTCWMIIQF
jgi:predicted SnoaL-like aldol condensation-catalyzing enzyme